MHFDIAIPTAIAEGRRPGRTEDAMKARHLSRNYGLTLVEILVAIGIVGLARDFDP